MTTRTQVTSLFQKFAGQSATLVIPRPYIDFCEGDHLAALLLSQILYWTERTADPDGWFAKSYDDWYEEIGLTDRQVKRIVKGDKRRQDDGFSLESVGIKTKLARSEYYQGAATLHYSVDHEMLAAKINAFSQVPTIGGNAQCGIPPIAQNDDPTIAQNDHIHRLRSETITTTGAKNAPDADAVETCSICGSPDAPHWLGYAYRCTDHKLTVRPPTKSRKRSANQLALDAMKNALADAFGLDHDKVTRKKWSEFGGAGAELIDVGATPSEMAPLHAWCAKQDWPTFTSMAMAKSYADWQKDRKAVTRPPVQSSGLTPEQFAAHRRELMEPFGTGEPS